MQMRLPSWLSRIGIFLVFGLIVSPVFAQTIKGKVYDNKTGEPLVGAVVTVANKPYRAVVNLDGGFTLHVPGVGIYRLIVSTVGYATGNGTEVEVKDRNEMKVDFPMQASATTLQEAYVTTAGSDGSDHEARRAEQRADMVQNILSARSIELSPDVTVANSLQRISGVTIQRNNSGEGRYAIIRGMAQRYNNTLVNGIKIPSPDDKYRFVPMDLFPSEMLERLEVIKSLTPNMEGDAIGGTMNLVMKNAPDHLILNVNGSLGYSTLFSDRPFSSFGHSGINKKSPAEINGNAYTATAADFPLGNLHYANHSSPVNGTLGLTVGNRFLDKKLGFVISASYQDFYRGSNSQYLVASAQPTPTAAGNLPSLQDAFERQYSIQTNRVGLHNKIDYVFNSKNKISLYNLYLHQNEFETRYTPDTTVGTNSSQTSKSVSVEYRSRWQIQDIYNATLQGEHLLSDNVKLDWSGVYSDARNQVPDMASYNFNANVLLNSGGKVTQVDSSTYGAGMTRIWQHNTDQDWAGYLNLTYTPHLFGQKVEFMGGGLYRYKTRDNYYNDYSLVPVADTVQTFHSIDNMALAFKPSTAGTGAVSTTLHANSYTSHEKIAAGFIQAKFMLSRKLQVLGGVRVENTQQDYLAAMPVTFDERQGTIQYTDVLPSLHFKYLLNQQQNIRLSYFKSISRPGFGEIEPYTVPGDFWNEIGNPMLKHTRADNLDLRYELFPGLTDQVLVGAFYKYLQNPIEYFYTRNGHPSDLFIQPQNVGHATNFGFEAVITKFFGMFGVTANYTYTHSSVTTTKLLYINGPSGNVTTTTNQTRPLQGQADHVGNLSLLYKNPRVGLDMQLAFAYTGTRIAQVDPYYGLDYWQRPLTQLDFSMEQRINKHFYFFAKVNNITNAPNKLYLKFSPSTVAAANGGALPFQTAGANYTTVQKDLYQLGLLGGFRFKL